MALIQHLCPEKHDHRTGFTSLAQKNCNGDPGAKLAKKRRKQKFSTRNGYLCPTALSTKIYSLKKYNGPINLNHVANWFHNAPFLARFSSIQRHYTLLVIPHMYIEQSDDLVQTQNCPHQIPEVQEVGYFTFAF